MSPTPPDAPERTDRPLAGRLRFGLAAAFALPLAAGVALAAFSGRESAAGAPGAESLAAESTAFPLGPATGDLADVGPPLATPRSPRVSAFSAPQTRPTQEERCPAYRIMQAPAEPYRAFYFTRGAYSADPRFWDDRGSRWAVDFEKADRQFLVVLRRSLGNMDIFPCENPVRLDDPHLNRFPYVYMLEVGSMWLTPDEVVNFRDYLLKGGFAHIDDFWGEYEWANFEREIKRVLPEFPIVEIPLDHFIFRIVYPIREILQVPNQGNGCTGDPSQYYEGDGRIPHVRGIFDDEGRLLVVITWNSDLGDAWEWAEQTCYPWDRANYAFQLGFNIITWAMTY